MKNILVHFEVDEEFLLIDTFIQSALSAKKTVEAINSLYFSDGIEFEVVVFPAESGSIKQYIGVIAKGVTGFSLTVLALVQFMDSQSVQKASRELFGKTPTETVVDRIRSLQSKLENNELDEEEIEAQSKEIIEEIVSRTATSSLESSREGIERLDAPSQFKFEIETAQSELYRAALDDNNVRSIGFSEEDKFPIPRNEFAARAIRPRKPDEESEDVVWEVTVERVRITSPNFDRDDQKSRKWKGKLTDDRTLLFEITDEQFWERLISGDVEFSEHTDIEVQLATKLLNSRANTSGLNV